MKLKKYLHIFCEFSRIFNQFIIKEPGFITLDMKENMV